MDSAMPTARRRERAPASSYGLICMRLHSRREVQPYIDQVRCLICPYSIITVYVL